jgi:hypothetical protein
MQSAAECHMRLGTTGYDIYRHSLVAAILRVGGGYILNLVVTQFRTGVRGEWAWVEDVSGGRPIKISSMVWF